MSRERFLDIYKRAKESGDTKAAIRALEAVKKLDSQFIPIGSLPGDFQNGVLPKEQPETPAAKKPERGFMDEVSGYAQALTSAITGVVNAPVAMTAGTLEQLAKEIKSGQFGTPEAAQRIKQNAEAQLQALTYQPETEAGMQRTKQLGEALAPLSALPPIIPELGAVGIGARTAGQRARVAGATVFDDALQIAKDRMAKSRQDLGRSVGASELDPGTLRRARAQELPVPIDLTEGQASRQFEQVQFEQTAAKMPDIGTPIRERFAEQNMRIQQNLDEFIDMTGGQAFSSREVGESVAQALRSRVASDKARIRRLYKEAKESGGMEQRADLDGLSGYLNKNRAQREENGIMTKVQRQLEAMEVSQGKFEDGTLELKPMTLNQAEDIRRFINKNIKNKDNNEIRIGSELKGIIDDSTEGLGNEKYRQARRARRKLAQDFENVALMKNLTGLKRGTEERAIALEDILNKAVFSKSTSRDSLHRLRRVLQNSGQEGKQAWKDIQAGTIQNIQDEILKNVQFNERGDRMVSAAKFDKVVRDLDNSGKLELLYGKKGAEQVRTLNEVAHTILTSPPGTINTSNTATVMAFLMDIAISGSAGVPAPVMSTAKAITGALKDRKLKKRVQDALRIVEP